MRLLLPAELQAAIEDAARASFPDECCGLIEGMREAGVASAVALHPGRNIAAHASDRFEIEPGDHFAALKAARANGRMLIGCYHSHPGGQARPSANDLLGAGEEDFLWLIAALPDATAAVTLGAFVYSGAEFRPVVVAGGADLVASSAKPRG